MLRSVKSLLFALSWITVVIGCSDQKSKDQQASEFYDEKLHVEDEKACNDKGFMYDTLTAACQDVPPKELKLPKFACKDGGIGANTTKEDESEVKKMREFLEDGYELRQCGVTSDGTIVVILILKGRTDDEATLVIQRLTFIGPSTASQKTNASDVASKEAYESLVFGERTSSGNGLCAEQRIEYRKSDGETSPTLTNAPVEVRLKLTYEATGVTVFSDADCKVVLASGDEIVIPKGNKYVEFYYKREPSYTATFEVNPDDPAIRIPEPLAIGGEPASSQP